MSILLLVVIVLALGFAAWLVQNKLPAVDQNFKTIAYVVLLAIAVIVVLNAFGACNGGLAGMRVPQLH